MEDNKKYGASFELQCNLRHGLCELFLVRVGGLWNVRKRNVRQGGAKMESFVPTEMTE